MVAPASRTALMIAYHYPPMRGSSGIQRTLKFAQDLPRAGWRAVVLSASRGAYQDLNMASAARADADPRVTVHRSWALDAARHCAVMGRYPGLLAQPDRWISWWLSAVPAGLRLIRRHRPDVIWSTYPIATAHLIALTLHRLTGIPWIADQRDPLTEADYPPDPRRRRIHGWIERQAVRHGAAVVCTTPGALRDWRARYPQAGDERSALIENGYDEASFAEAEAAPRWLHGQAPDDSGTAGLFRLLHSGVIYPSERDPRCLFSALRRLMEAGAIGQSNFRLVLRATGHDDYLRPLLARHGISPVVELAPPLPYRDALAEMLAADGLLLLQAANCNNQVPAKLYEYLRARRPLLALTDPAGDTAAALRRAGPAAIARLDSEEDIAVALEHFLRRCRAGAATLACADSIAAHSREARALQLAELFGQILHRKERS